MVVLAFTWFLRKIFNGKVWTKMLFSFNKYLTIANFAVRLMF